MACAGEGGHTTAWPLAAKEFHCTYCVPVGRGTSTDSSILHLWSTTITIFAQLAQTSDKSGG